jgi:hypothetical protein
MKKLPKWNREGKVKCGNCSRPAEIRKMKLCLRCYQKVKGYN